MNKCYDGKAFFASDHIVGDGKKAKSYSNKGTARLSRAAYRAARKAIMSLVDENGDSLNLVPDLLIVAPGERGRREGNPPRRRDQRHDQHRQGHGGAHGRDAARREE